MEYFQAALGVAGGVGQLFGAGKQETIDKERVRLQYADSLEKIRRREFTQEQILGRTKAFSQASGVLHTGGSSAQGVIDTMSREFRLEIDWMKKFAEKSRELGLKSARADSKANMLKGLGSIGQGLFQGMGAYFENRPATTPTGGGSE
jgi:hypothetical protein